VKEKSAARPEFERIDDVPDEYIAEKSVAILKRSGAMDLGRPHQIDRARTWL
jgi:hypothetical protein